MAKTCNKKDCNNPQFGGGFCKWHQYKRTDKKKPSPIKKTLIKTEYKPTGERALFDVIYLKNKHNWVSRLSGEPLFLPNHYLFYNQFIHILSKAQNKYPKFKLFEPNIWLLTPEEHTLYDFGTEKQRAKYALENNCDWGVLLEEKAKLIELYNKYYI
jgi:hypothetical protein